MQKEGELECRGEREGGREHNQGTRDDGAIRGSRKEDGVLKHGARDNAGNRGLEFCSGMRAPSANGTCCPFSSVTYSTSSS
eukprot:2933199-Pleurochrysis_carterae.AAC.1